MSDQYIDDAPEELGAGYEPEPDFDAGSGDPDFGPYDESQPEPSDPRLENITPGEQVAKVETSPSGFDHLANPGVSALEVSRAMQEALPEADEHDDEQWLAELEQQLDDDEQEQLLTVRNELVRWARNEPGVHGAIYEAARANPEGV